MDNELKELIDLILRWWKEAECDSFNKDGEEYNVYDQKPDFVEEAERLKSEYGN